MEQMRLQAENVGAELSYEVITEVKIEKGFEAHFSPNIFKEGLFSMADLFHPLLI